MVGLEDIASALARLDPVNARLQAAQRGKQQKLDVEAQRKQNIANLIQNRGDLSSAQFSGQLIQQGVPASGVAALLGTFGDIDKQAQIKAALGGGVPASQASQQQTALGQLGTPQQISPLQPQGIAQTEQPPANPDAIAAQELINQGIKLQSSTLITEGQRRLTAAQAPEKKKQEAAEFDRRELVKQKTKLAESEKTQRKESRIQGFTLKEGFLPPPAIVNKFRDQIIANKNLSQNITRIIDIIDNTFQSFGKESKLLKGLVSDTTTELNTLARLGALSEGDLEVLKGNLPEATDLFTRDDVSIAVFKQLKEIVDRKVDNFGSTLGFVSTLQGDIKTTDNISELSTEELQKMRNSLSGQ